MAELARWQWDDQGQWRDFAEQYQAEMEACFQSRAPSVEVTIPPYGTFRMDVKGMKQVTVKGRNPGYEREIRRQARKIEVGYFILGHEGDIFASDSVVDQIEAVAVLETLIRLLGKIVDEPEDFGNRSVSLAEEEYRDTLGECKEAVDFLKERGFEEIEEGNSRFLVFMQEDVMGLREAKREVEARRERARKGRPSASQASGFCSNALVESNQVFEESNDVVPGQAQGSPSNAPEAATVDNNEVAGPSPTGYRAPAPPERGATRAAASSSGRKGRGKGRRSAAEGKGKGRNNARGSEKASAAAAAAPWGPDAAAAGLDGPGAAAASDAGKAGRFMGPAPGGSAATSSGAEGPLALELLLPSGAPQRVELPRGSLDELLQQAVKASGLRLPLVRAASHGATPLGLAAEPGRSLGEAAGLRPGEQLCVEDFEGAFVERLQSGLLRLQDLAVVAPLLDWEKPELPKLLLGRLRSLLEGSCASWCQAAGCSADEELGYGRALLRRLYGEKPLEERMEVCKRLLPSEKRDEKTVLRVDRSNYISSALGGLEKLSREHLRRPFTVQFVGEVAEDHGGPRRDFFGSLGARLADELPALWKRSPKGALVPVADVVAEDTPKSQRLGLERVEAVYRACGRACGLAAKHGDVIGEDIAGFFLHQVARDDSVGLEELQRQLSEADGDDIRTSKVVLHKNLAELGLQGTTLSRVITGTEAEVDLIPGGRSVAVTEDNKAEWLHLHLHDKLYGSLRKAADAFRDGILDVMGGTRGTCPLLVLLSPAELARAWAGCAVGDEHLQKWREVACVSTEIRQQADWLWEILREGDEALRGRVLRFATGIHRLGGAGLQCFEVQPADGGDESLPRAMTCANMLQLPRYSSKVVLEQQLRKATELCDGFQVL